jgi:peptidoglycan/LPS O-acetylase OafA/YrhL
MSSARQEAEWWSGPGILRLYLAFLVVLNHSSPFYWGLSGVFMFFILSGYWISKMLRETYSRCRNPLFTFYVSRYWRIFPLMALCIALDTADFIYFQGVHSEAYRALHQPLWWLGKLSIAGCTYGTMLPLTMWSLAIEFQFYLFAPLIVPLCKWLGNRLIFVIAVIMCLEFIYAPVTRDGHFGTILNYLGFFLLGIWVETHQTQVELRTAVKGLIAWGVIYFAFVATPGLRDIAFASRHFNGPMHIYTTKFQIVGALLMTPYVIFTLSRRSSKMDRELGNLAYPLYLFHLLPLEFAWLMYGYPSLLLRIEFRTVAFVVAIVGTLAIYFLFDKPIDRLRSNWVHSRQLPAAPRSEVVAPAPVFEASIAVTQTGAGR